MILAKLLAWATVVQPSDETSNELDVSVCYLCGRYQTYKKSLKLPFASAAA
jgi:hypothetical protein